MTKVCCASPDYGMRICVGPEVMERPILECGAVLRPLDCPSTIGKYGKVLAHSAILARTSKEYVLIEYMNVNLVLVNRVGNLKWPKMKKEDFKYKGLIFKFISDVQEPKTSVTIREFAEKMVDYMKGHTFDTFTHNCHHARYLTMKYYGMHSEDPYSVKKSVLFQGIADYFKRY